MESTGKSPLDMAIERALSGLPGRPQASPPPAAPTLPPSRRTSPRRQLPPPTPKEEPADVIRDVLGEEPEPPDDGEGPELPAPVTTPWFDKIRDAILRAGKGKALDRVMKALYGACEQGLIDGEELRQLDAMVEIRRELPAIPRRNPHRFGSRPRTVDSLARRRRTFMGGWVPPHLAWHFTPGQLAVLSIVAREIVEKGSCHLYIDQIGAMAGVGRTLVKNALRIAERLDMVKISERKTGPYRNLPNCVTVNTEGQPAGRGGFGSPGREWAEWLKHRRRSRARHGSDSFAASTPNQHLYSVALTRDKVARRAASGGPGLPEGGSASLGPVET